MFAELFTHEYKLVKRVPLPPGDRPEVIVDGLDVYRYYAHTTAVGTVETEHPYRRTTERIPVSGAYVVPTSAHFQRPLRIPEDDIITVPGPFRPNVSLIRESLARYYPELFPAAKPTKE